MPETRYTTAQMVMGIRAEPGPHTRHNPSPSTTTGGTCPVLRPPRLCANRDTLSRAHIRPKRSFHRRQARNTLPRQVPAKRLGSSPHLDMK